MRAMGGAPPSRSRGPRTSSRGPEPSIVPGLARDGRAGSRLHHAAAIRDAHRRGGADPVALLRRLFRCWPARRGSCSRPQRDDPHWRYPRRPRPAPSRHPPRTGCPDVLYVDEGQILTAAGSAAGIDLCLPPPYPPGLIGPRARERGGAAPFVRGRPHPRRRDKGADRRGAGAVARTKGARDLFPAPRPPAPGSRSSAYDRRDERPPVGMSDRTFLRRFKAMTGTTPAEVAAGGAPAPGPRTARDDAPADRGRSRPPAAPAPRRTPAPTIFAKTSYGTSPTCLSAPVRPKRRRERSGARARGRLPPLPPLARARDKPPRMARRACTPTRPTHGHAPRHQASAPGACDQTGIDRRDVRSCRERRSPPSRPRWGNVSWPARGLFSAAAAGRGGARARHDPALSWAITRDAAGVSKAIAQKRLGGGPRWKGSSPSRAGRFLVPRVARIAGNRKSPTDLAIEIECGARLRHGPITGSSMLIFVDEMVGDGREWL